MPTVFSRTTLGKFEDASASIPLRNIARAFDRENVHLGEDPGGPEGARRTHFRRYVAGVDQHVPEQLARLGNALGALIAEVATSKVDFLVKAAETDGFFFADGVFRVGETTATSFAVTRVADSAFIDECGKRLHLLANDRPIEAIGGARELLETLCRTVLRLVGEPLPKETVAVGDVAKTTLDALRLISRSIGDTDTELADKRFQQLVDLAAILGEVLNVGGSADERKGKLKSPSPRYARLAAGAAVTFAAFVAETYVEISTTGLPAKGTAR